MRISATICASIGLDRRQPWFFGSFLQLFRISARPPPQRGVAKQIEGHGPQPNRAGPPARRQTSAQADAAAEWIVGSFGPLGRRAACGPLANSLPRQQIRETRLLGGSYET